VPSDMVKTVAFLCIKRNDGTMVPKGTAFFVGYRRGVKLRMYVVTAKHVLDKIRQATAADAVFITYNGTEGKDETRLDSSEWNYHPAYRAENVDVAIARFDYRGPDLSRPPFVNPHVVRCWMLENILTLSAAIQSGIGTGYEVGLAGLFVHHRGSDRNIPIVRSGNIAAMPQEPVSTTMGPMTAFLVEIRSVGGLSGSPVFTVTADGKIGLLGLVHGHFDQRSSDLDIIAEDEASTFYEERINSGIAIVVPADRIRETLKPLTDIDFP
jgi:hypothetical protein